MSDLKRRFGFGNLTGGSLPCSPCFLRYIQTKFILIQNFKISLTLLQSALFSLLVSLGEGEIVFRENVTPNARVTMFRQQPWSQISCSNNSIPKHEASTVFLNMIR